MIGCDEKLGVNLHSSIIKSSLSFGRSRRYWCSLRSAIRIECEQVQALARSLVEVAVSHRLLIEV